MEDKTVKQGQSAPKANGRLTVRVFTNQGGAPVGGAPVKATSGADTLPPGTTNDAGEFSREVAPGDWYVEVTAFGKTHTDNKAVQAKCEAEVPFYLSVSPHINFRPAGTAGPPSGSNAFTAGTVVEASYDDELAGAKFDWTVTGGSIVETPEDRNRSLIHVTTGPQGRSRVQATINANGVSFRASGDFLAMPAPTVPISGAMQLGLRRSAGVITPDLPLWAVIRNSTEGLSFKRYTEYVDAVLCCKPLEGYANPTKAKEEFNGLRQRRFLPFSDADAYRLLKVATEAFVMVNCGIALDSYPPFKDKDFELLIGRTGVTNLGKERFEGLWTDYLVKVNGTTVLTLPYLAQIASKFPDARTKVPIISELGPSCTPEELCHDILLNKLSAPCLVELIWSYWHEEAMLVQTMNAISIRFQNRLTRGADPLARMEIASLRPLNNLLWGYVQDEQHRLTVVRRGHEYDHEYGLRLEGRATARMRTADSRSQFLPAFHHLLHQCTLFFQRDDNTTVVADAFPVLNALKEVHLILSQGAHNQFGDLPVTARVEMLMQQWLLSREEFSEFLPSRAMVSYPEPWMDRVDAMKKLQGWSDVSVLHFRDLAIFGERLLLTIRHGSWVDVTDPDQAKNWLRVWRPEIQGYIHAYRAVTGADVTAEPVNTTLPSVLLRQKLAQQPRPGGACGD